MFWRSGARTGLSCTIFKSSVYLPWSRGDTDSRSERESCMMEGFWNRLTDRRLLWSQEGYEDSVLEPLLSAFFTPTPTRNTRRKWEKSSGESIPARNCPYLPCFFRSFENTREPARRSLMRVCSRCSLSTWKNSNRDWKNSEFARLSL